MKSDSISFPVLKVSQPIGDFFMGRLKANALVNISYADVRRIESEQRDIEKYLGIQRPLDQTRVKQIKEYLKAPDASFPTGVILAIDQNCAELDQQGFLTLKAFISDFPEDSIPLNKVAKVLDGQHRIAAFTDHLGNFDSSLEHLGSSFEFNVILFVGLDIDEQANIFATVNLAQTKVNKSLVYDLEGLSKTKSPFRTCHQIAVALDSADTRSPLFHRIKRLGVKTQGREESEPLTQAVFVESLIKLISPNPFVDRTTYMRGDSPSYPTIEELKKYPFRNFFIKNRDLDIALILINYFNCIKELWPVAWERKEQVGNILPRSNAFKAFMRYLKNTYASFVNDDFDKIPTKDEFKKLFSHLKVSDSDFTSGNFKPGSGGESSFYKLLIGEISIQDLKN